MLLLPVVLLEPLINGSLRFRHHYFLNSEEDLPDLEAHCSKGISLGLTWTRLFTLLTDVSGRPVSLPSGGASCTRLLVLLSPGASLLARLPLPSPVPPPKSCCLMASVRPILLESPLGSLPSWALLALVRVRPRRVGLLGDFITIFCCGGSDGGIIGLAICLPRFLATLC